MLQHQRFLECVFDAVASKKLLKTGYVRQVGGLYPANCDTVAGHSHAVSVIALILTFEISQELKDYCGYFLNTEDIITLAVIHDHGEARSGDTGAQSMATYGECKLFSLERDALAASFDGLVASETVLRLFDDYRKYSTPEALVVHAADVLEGFEKALEHFHNRPLALDRSLKTISHNLQLFRERQAVGSPVLEQVGHFLADRVLYPCIDGLLQSYGLSITLLE